LPHYVSAAYLHENIGVFAAELEGAVERELYGYQRDRQTSAKDAIVFKASFVSGRIKVAGNGPKGNMLIVCHRAGRYEWARLVGSVLDSARA
jgi:hypothetical protein